MNNHWWCPTCKQVILGCNVTFEEYHDNCGTPVEWVEGEDLLKCEQLEQQLQSEQQAHNALRKKLKELEWLWFEDDELAGSGFVCPCCEQRWDNSDDINANKHLTGCWLNAELQAIKEDSK